MPTYQIEFHMDNSFQDVQAFKDKLKREREMNKLTGKYRIDPRCVEDIESFKTPQIPKSHNLKIDFDEIKIFCGFTSR